jgi:hypothetical protein
MNSTKYRTKTERESTSTLKKSVLGANLTNRGRLEAPNARHFRARSVSWVAVATRSPTFFHDSKLHADTMKLLTLLFALLVPTLIAVLIYVPEAAPYAWELTHASLVFAALVVVLIACLPSAKLAVVAPRAEAPQPPPSAANQAEAEIVTFLAILQDKGRFVDFVMDDITAYDDQQVGAAARVVHAGCRAALSEHLDIRPVHEEAEGSSVTVQAGYAPDEYRLIGKIGGNAPFSGTLIHRGWRAESVTLPRVLKVRGDRLPTVAPAEVELR